MKTMTKIRGIVFILCSLYLLLWFVGSLVYLLIDPNTSFVELLKTIYALGLWFAVPILVIVLLLRTWRLSLVALFMVIMFGVIYMPYLLPRNPVVDEDMPQLTVMTFNLKATSDGIAEVVRNADVDIVGVQELSIEGAENLRQLEDIYPYQALHPQEDPNIGQGILSRYPIEASTYWEYPDLPHTLGHQRVEVDFQGMIIVVYNTHPWPPLAWESGYDDESHRIVLQDIARRTFAEDLPVILVGDFNMTDSFEEYDLFASRFVDSYRAAGNGIGYTFPNNKYKPLPSILRLDYIWHSENFESVQAEVWDNHAQSDHSPVIATLALNQENR